MEDYKEFTEMREQISLLKEKLANEAIINDRLLRETTRTKVSFIQKKGLLFMVLGLVAAPYCYFAFDMVGLGTAFCAATAIMMMFSAFMTAIMHIRVNSNTATSGSLVECVTQIKKLKKQYKDWYKVAIPMLAVWFGWLIYEVLQSVVDRRFAMILICGMFFGGVIGALIGFRAHRKVIDTCDEVISLLEEK